MKAAWLEAIGSPLKIREVADPAASASGVIVRVLAVRVPNYTRKIFDGSLKYDIHPPFVPGPTCVGQVESVGEDVFDVKIGDVVLCNSLLSSGDIAGSPDEILIAWTGSGSERSRAMQEMWRDGSFAQLAHYPARCLTVLPEADQFERSLLPFLASIAIADGGLRRAELKAGQVVVIKGATGQLGGAAVLLALANGAAAVIAAGRNKQRLKTLSEIDSRVSAHVLFGERHRDADALRAWNLVRTGAVDLSIVTPHAFGLDGVEQAIDTALTLGGLDYALLLPNG